MADIKPNMDCELCFFIQEAFGSERSCDECVADAVGEGFQASPERQKAVADIMIKRETA